jgi:DnaJ homolog subfamily C member 19
MLKFLLAAVLIWLVWNWLRKPMPQRRLVADESEARAILGVDPAATSDEIRAAHRRLVAAVHPDRGGSAELARRINAARDLLLKRS